MYASARPGEAPGASLRRITERDHECHGRRNCLSPQRRFGDDVERVDCDNAVEQRHAGTGCQTGRQRKTPRLAGAVADMQQLQPPMLLQAYPQFSVGHWTRHPVDHDWLGAADRWVAA